MRLTMFAAAAACFAPGVASANELLNVYRAAAQNDTVLRASGFAREATLQNQPLARASLLPQVSGSYSYDEGQSEGTSTQTGEDPDSGQVITIANEFDTDRTSEEFSVTASQTVFDWGAIQTLGQASKQAALAEVTYRAAEQDLVLRAAQVYFSMLAAADGLRFAEAEHKAVERQLEQAKKRFEVGLSAITDVQEAQAAYDLTVAQALQAQQTLENSKQALREITDADEVKLVPLREEIPLPGPVPQDVGSWIARAQTDNLDLIAARLGTEIARRGVRIARAGHLPRVTVGAQYSDGNTETDFSGNDSTDLTYGVTVNVPIFSGFYVRSQVRQASALHEQRKAEEEGSSRSVERQTRDAFLGVMSGAGQVRALRQAVISSTTALEASETGFQVGTRTTVDVLNSQRDLFSAQRDYASARYNYLLSILSLKAAAGTLSEADLAEIDALLTAG